MDVAPDAVVLAGGQEHASGRSFRASPSRWHLSQDVPFLAWLLRALEIQGIRRVVLSTGHGAAQIESFVEGEARAGGLGLEIVCVHESRVLGTGGGLRNALSEIRTARVLVSNADSLCPFELPALLHLHAERRARATLLLTRVADTRRFGSVEVDPHGGISAFHEKHDSGGPGLVNAGVYLLEREVVTSIPVGREVSLEREVFPSWIGKGMFGLVTGGPLVDIGTAESYAAANSRLGHGLPTPDTPS